MNSISQWNSLVKWNVFYTESHQTLFTQLELPGQSTKSRFTLWPGSTFTTCVCCCIVPHSPVVTAYVPGCTTKCTSSLLCNWKNKCKIVQLHSWNVKCEIDKKGFPNFSFCVSTSSHISLSLPNLVLEILTGLLCRALVYFTESWNREQWSLSSGSFMLEQHVL